MKKRTLSLLLAFVLTFGMLPVQAFAAEITEDPELPEAAVEDESASDAGEPEEAPSSADRENEQADADQPETDQADTEQTDIEQGEKASIITGFAPLPQDSYSVSADASEADAAAALPATVIAYLQDSDTPAEITVTWYCPDYGAEECSEFTFYASVSGYTLADGVASPSAIVTVLAEEDEEEVDDEESYGSCTYSAANEEYVYNFLRNVLKLNAAQTCGVMGNLYIESRFDPAAYNGNDSGGTTSYGICQWNSGSNNNGRYYSLISWCNSNGYDYTSLEGQLYYMKHELDSVSYYRYSTLRTYANTSDGAADAALLWAKYFEGCSSASYETRQNYASTTFWQKYGDGSTSSGSDSSTPVKISGATYPTVQTVGRSFDICGVITSGSALTSVTVGVFDINGTMQIGKTVYPNTTSYNLVNVDNDIVFGKLSAGVYTYQIKASTASGTNTLVSKVFPVLSTSQEISNGTYKICSGQNSAYVLMPSGKSASTGAPIVFSSWSGNSSQVYTVSYIGSGYYSLTNQVSGLALTVQGTSIVQSAYCGADTQLWQILSAGSYRVLVPKSSTTSCAGTAASSVYENAVLSVSADTLSTAQLFYITAAQAENEPDEKLVTGFVTRLYTTCLGREPDSGGLAYWVDDLMNRRISGCRVAEYFVFSQEMNGKNYCNECFIKMLYRAIMGREYDQGGLDYWNWSLSVGVSRQKLVGYFLTSKEFAFICDQYGINCGNGVIISTPPAASGICGCCGNYF